MKEISIKSPTNFSRADVGNGIAKNGLISNFTVRLGCEISLNLCRFASFYQAMDQVLSPETKRIYWVCFSKFSMHIKGIFPMVVHNFRTVRREPAKTRTLQSERGWELGIF